MKVFELLAVPPTVTITGPVVAPLGMVTTMLAALQLVAVAEVPLNVTVLVPWIRLKFVPVMVMVPVIAPEDGDKLVMVGAPTNHTLLLGRPLTVTTMLPVNTPAGAGTTI